jgi:type II secretory pathway component PulC
MRMLALASILGLGACASTASADGRCERVSAQLAETQAQLDDVSARFGKVMDRIAELEAHTKQIERAQQHSTSSSDSREPELDEILSCREDGCTITRAGLELILASPAWLASQALVVPALRDGLHEGFKLYGIRRGSLPARLGFKNGDFLVSLNGHSLESLELSMRAYEAVRRGAGSKLEFEVQRRSEPHTVTLQIE